MPDKLVLTYFNSKGRAEMTRLLLAYAGMEYEDKRLTQEEWQPLKAKVPTGQLPMLEVNGVKICQSVAIAHYVARKAKLCGKDDVEAAQAEMVVHTIGDIINKAVIAFFEKDEAKKAELMTNFKEEFLPPVINKLEFILSNNGGQYIVGNQVTWADIVLADFFSPEGLSKFLKLDAQALAPKMFEHQKKILALPKLKEWIDKRPKTEN